MIRDPISLDWTPYLKPMNEYSERKFFALCCIWRLEKVSLVKARSSASCGSPSAIRQTNKQPLSPTPRKKNHIEEIRSGCKSEKSEKGREKKSQQYHLRAWIQMYLNLVQSFTHQLAEPYIPFFE